MAHQSQDIPAVQTALIISMLLENATEAMYAQGEQGQDEAKARR
jgi:molecular chaperone DnaK